MRRGLPALALLVLAGCAPGTERIAFHVRGAPPDDPFRGADTLVVALERGGRTVAGTEQIFPIDAPALELVDLPFGEDLALRVEARFGDLVLARGRSFPFDYLAADAAPARPPDVLIGTLGRFAQPLSELPPGTPLALAPAPDGARVATASTVLAYRAHAAQGVPSLEPIASVPASRAGALWLAAGDDLIALGGAEPGATRFDPEGRARELALDGSPRAAAALPDGERVIVWLADGSVVRVDPDATAELARLDAPTADAVALAVPARLGDRDVVRVLLADGDRAFVVDPEGIVAPSSASLAPARRGRVIAVVGTGLVLVAGGVDEAGVVSDEVALWVLRPDRDPSLEAVSPAPPLLFAARARASVASFGEGLLLISGGTGAAGEPLASAELIDATALPGDVVATGALPFADARPLAVSLRDRTVLVAGAGGIAVYFPPRGEP